MLVVLPNFTGIPTLFFQIVFLLESARSNNSMSMSACALVDIRRKIFFLSLLVYHIHKFDWRTSWWRDLVERIDWFTAGLDVCLRLSVHLRQSLERKSREKVSRPVSECCPSEITWGWDLEIAFWDSTDILVSTPRIFMSTWESIQLWFDCELVNYIFFLKMDSRQALAFIVAYKIAKSQKWGKKGQLNGETSGLAKSIRSLFHTLKWVEARNA